MPEAGVHRQAVEFQTSSDMSLKLAFIDKQLIISPVPDMSPRARVHCQAAEHRAGVTHVAWCPSSLPIGL